MHQFEYWLQRIDANQPLNLAVLCHIQKACFVAGNFFDIASVIHGSGPSKLPWVYSSLSMQKSANQIQIY